MGQAKEPARVFRPALEQVRPQTQIPILLPSKLPSPLRERDIKLASGTASENEYWIELYYAETGSNATFAAAFGASAVVSRDVRPRLGGIRLAGGRLGIFMPVSCGGSCAPANLWWEQNGVTYQIQIKLPSTMKEKDQEKILVETANSMVVVRGE
jgi:hypothetical protein